MRLPKELITITPLSKTLAVIASLVLPFIGFFSGIRYEEFVSQNDPTYQLDNNSVLPEPPQDQYAKNNLGMIWKKYQSSTNIYTNTQYNFSFNIPVEYLISENIEFMKEDASFIQASKIFHIMLHSKEYEVCLGKNNPCGLTNQSIGILDINAYNMNLNSNLKTWIENKYKSSPITRLEFVKSVKTQYLSNGVSIHDMVGMGDGVYYWYFYQPDKNMLIEFSSKYNIAKNANVLAVVNSFHFDN
jgi:hypothetical protein